MTDNQKLTILGILLILRIICVIFMVNSLLNSFPGNYWEQKPFDYTFWILIGLGFGLERVYKRIDR